MTDTTTEIWLRWDGEIFSVHGEDSLRTLLLEAAGAELLGWL
jgi:hypothetical protein